MDLAVLGDNMDTTQCQQYLIVCHLSLYCMHVRGGGGGGYSWTLVVTGLPNNSAAGECTRNNSSKAQQRKALTVSIHMLG